MVTTLEAIALRRQLTVVAHEAAVPDRQAQRPVLAAQPVPGQPRIRPVPRQPDAVRVLRRQGPAAPAAGQLQEGQLAPRRLRQGHRSRLRPDRPGQAPGRDGGHARAPRDVHRVRVLLRLRRPPAVDQRHGDRLGDPGVRPCRPAAEHHEVAPVRTGGLWRLHHAGPHRRGHARADGRHALPAVLVRAAAVHHQRAAAVGDRPVRLRRDHRRSHRRAAVAGGGARGAQGAAGQRHRRLVHVLLPGARVHP